MLPQIFLASSPWLDICSNASAMQKCKTQKPPKAPNPAPSIIVPQDTQQEMFAPENTKRETIPLQFPPASYSFPHSTQHWAMKSYPIPDSGNQSETRTLATHFVLRKISVSFPSTARKNSLPTSAAFSLRHLSGPCSNLAREHGRSTSPKGFREISKISKPKNLPWIFVGWGKAQKLTPLKALWGDTSTMTNSSFS